MNAILLVDRLYMKISGYYRKKLFKAKTKCNHNDYKILGHIHVNNPNVILGKNVVIFPGVMFFGKGPILIGDNTKIGNNTIIYSSKGGGVSIGSHTAIAAECYIIDADHGIKKGILVDQQDMVVQKVKIGNNVWLGTHAVVLKGSIINDGAVIGAMSLVNSEIEKESINVGIPAKLIKYKD